jgi:hypothetical protein
MRNEQLQGKISKQDTQQRQIVDTKKNTAFSFISFIMQDVTHENLDQKTDPTTNQTYDKNNATLFDNVEKHYLHLTEFQLSEEEILKEMLTHLAADCPVMMQNKEDLIAKISSQYEKMKEHTIDSVLDLEKEHAQDANGSDEIL